MLYHTDPAGAMTSGMLAAFTDALPFPWLVFDEHGMIIFASSAAARLEVAGYPLVKGEIPAWMSADWPQWCATLQRDAVACLPMGPAHEMRLFALGGAGEHGGGIGAVIFPLTASSDERLATFVHDMNNSFGRVLGYLEIATDHLEEDDPARTFIARSLQSLEQAGELLGQFARGS
ncbi:MAG: hypothetical protein RIQ52_943 [Pseudomonadota bacterium]